MATCSQPLLQDDFTPRQYTIEEPDIDVRPGRYYTETNDKRRPVIFTTCQVCRFKIYLADSIKEQSSTRLAHCPACKKWTPFNNPPEGYRYVRCSCCELITCSISLRETVCHKKDCKKKIKLRPHEQEPIYERYSCAYCPNVFQAAVGKKHDRCNLCGRLSSLGENHFSFWVFWYTVLGFLISGGGIATALATYTIARRKDHWPIYLSWAMCGILGFFCFLRAGWTAKVKTSARLPNIN